MDFCQIQEIADCDMVFIHYVLDVDDAVLACDTFWYSYCVARIDVIRTRCRASATSCQNRACKKEYGYSYFLHRSFPFLLSYPAEELSIDGIGLINGISAVIDGKFLRRVGDKERE